jgi:hypothetical protein
MSKFSPTLSSRSVFYMGDTQIHVALKYTAPWRTTLRTNCSWEQMANGATNCCMLLINHKQTPMHELYCSPWNIMPSSGPQVNYFPSFQKLSAHHACWFICKIRMRLAASGAPVAVQRRAVEPVNKVKKISLYYKALLSVNQYWYFLIRQAALWNGHRTLRKLCTIQ